MEILSLWLHIIMFFLQYQTGFCLLNYTTKNHLCREDQSKLLLQLKQQLSPVEEYSMLEDYHPDHPKNHYKTMFWKKSSDCCLWDGVTCDRSGHVIGLDLSWGFLTGNIDSNSSIFYLSHLRNLNLAFNHFDGSEISFKFGRLNRLTHLNLSHSGFGGQIAPEFYYLSNLVSLDISSDPNDPTIDCDVKMLLGNMTKIRVLFLPFVNISSKMPMNMSSFLTHLDLSYTGIHGKLPVSILEKPNLQVLRLYGNQGLKGSLPKRLNQSNVQSLKELDLSWTSISGRLPESIGFMNNLKYMKLFYCKFWGPIPESVGNITEIIVIDLSGNEFSGKLPSAISSLQQLTHLHLSYNRLQGQLPNAFWGLQRLTHLYLQDNYLVGQIPSSLTNMSQLESLDISSNALTGPFPSGAGDGLQKLFYMDFSNNSIQGMIPPWLLSLPSLESLQLNSNSLSGKIGKFNCSRLKSLDLSFNRLSGQTGKFNCKSLFDLDLSNNQLIIELKSFFNLSKIAFLSLSYNTVTEHARDIVNVTLPDLQQLDLSSCKIKDFHVFLRNLPNLRWLDLSNNQMHGPIPRWFRSIPWQDLSYLNLSTNYLTCVGHLPWQNLNVLNLNYNSLQGTFPSSICNMSRLFILNLSNNKLTGKIPQCIGNISLVVLDLRSNQFHGKIPTTIGAANNRLAILTLNRNHLEGPLPRSLSNCSYLEVLDLGNNKIHDTFPWWLGTLPYLRILLLRSNWFHGSIRPTFPNNSFSELKIVDLSYNNFTGLLPEQLFARLQSMKNQAEAANCPEYIAHRTITYQELHRNAYLGSNRYQYSVTLSVKGVDVELMTRLLCISPVIDLSSNNFYGCIPESLAYLNSLRLLNLSHNSISGGIPPALGHMAKLEQLDLSSNQLTGGIPQFLASLTFLAVLNLSHNHLVGPIPQANQFPTFSNDSYIGNSGLCGAPLTKKCGDNKVPSPPAILQEEDDSGFMMGFTWKAVVMGYGCGIVFGFIIGNVMISTGKPIWLARFVHAEAANYLNRRKKRGRMVQGRR